MGIEKNITWFIGAKYYIMLLSFVFSILNNVSIAQNNCRVKEKRLYQFVDDSTEKVVLIETCFYRKDGEMCHINSYSETGKVIREICFVFDNQSRCVLVYSMSSEDACDTIAKAFEVDGKLLPIRIRAFSSQLMDNYKKVVYNKCQFPKEITIYLESSKKTILSRYKLKYKYW